MKKHPIDDLFSRKLHGAEIAPREEAYQKLQARMQAKQRRIGGWWQQGPWLAAAGVCLFLGAGWVLWKNNTPQNLTTAQIISQQTPVTATTPEQVARTTEKISVENKANLKRNAEAKELKIAKIQRVEPKNSNLKQAEIKADFQEQVAKVMEETAIKNQSLSLTNEESKVVAQANMPSVKDTKPRAKTVFLQLPSIKETLVVATEQNGNTTNIEEVEIHEDLINKPRKSSRMAKVWQQLKNAKNGEKVDWEEVGINSKLLAKASKK